MSESSEAWSGILKIRHLLVLCCFAACAVVRAAEPDNGLSQLEQVYNLLRTNLNATDTAKMDSAAVKSLLNQFHAKAILVSQGTSDGASSVAAPLGKSTIFDESFAYFRVARVGGDLPDELKNAYQQMSQTNKSKIKGVVLDLRFADGDDYACAGTTADCFLNSDQLLLDWGTGTARATAKSDSISTPVAVLVNGKTSEAAEALAVALRIGKPALVIGNKTAGEANAFKDFPLANGDKLRIAMGQIKLGDGTSFSGAVEPDIAVNTSTSDDEAYLKDPYQLSEVQSSSRNTTNSQYAVDRSSLSRRFNEVELIREHKEGADLEQELGNAPDAKEIPPV